MTHDDPILARLRSLETRQRRIHVVAACGTALLLAAMAGPPHGAVTRREVLEVDELRVVHEGEVRLRLGVDADGAASLVLQDPSGTRRVALTAPVGAPARLELFGPDGAPQPLIRQIAGEAEALGRDAAAEVQRGIEAAVVAEVDRFYDALSALLGEGDPAATDAATGPPLLMGIVAQRSDSAIDLADEQRRLRAWIADHPAASTEPYAIEAFQALPASRGGRASDAVRWFPHVVEPQPDAPQGTEPPRWRPALSRSGVDGVVPAFDDAAWNGGRVPEGGLARLIEYVPIRTDLEVFTAADIDRAKVRAAVDDFGHPAILYEMRGERGEAFADWSEAHVGRCAAIVAEGRVISAPRFVSRISGPAMITGNLTQDDVEELVRRLRAEGR